MENKINKVHNAYLCFIELKWAIGVKKTSVLCFVLFANMSLVGTGTISNTSLYQP